MRFKRYHFNEISSTNEYIKELSKESELLAVSADFQTAGRGRNGKSWQGDYGKNIYLSLSRSFKTSKSYSNPGIYQAQASIVIKRVLSEFFPNRKFKLKYPNDIMAKDESKSYRKIGGILIENSYLGNMLDKIIIGIGINCEQEDFPVEIKNKATSLKLLNLEFDKDKIIDKIINEFEQEWKTDSNQKEKIIFYAWASELSLFNKAIQIVGEEGIWYLKQILTDCRLELESDSKIKIIDNGDSIRYELK